MLRPKKKITKRELKEDTLVLTYFKVQNLISDYRKQIGIVAVSAVVLLGAGVVYNNNRTANEQKAAVELGKVFTYFDNGSYKLAVDGIPEKNFIGLKSIADNYGSTPSGELAMYYLANAYYKLDDYDKSLKYFEEFDTDDELLKTSTLSGTAACYEAKGEFLEAAKYFERAARSTSDKVLLPENLANAARDYILAGKKEKAVDIFKRIKKEFPESPQLREAERSLAELSV